MGQKEIFEISNSESEASRAMSGIVKKILEENPDVSYTRLDYDKDTEIIKMLIQSKPPTVSPFFLSMYNGKIVGSLSGIVSKTELSKLIN
jgi:hypothetical protein